MNHIYRLVWSQISQAWIAVAENAKGHGKSISTRKLVTAAAAVIGGALLASSPSSGYAANAADATVVGGVGSVSQLGATTTINQTSQRLAIDWTNLSTAANEALVFSQPNASAIALNRITGSSPSALLGSLSANGQVYILNPNGVLFGSSAQVNVGGLVASTLSMSTDDFMAGSSTFSKGTDATGSVVNQGTLTAANGYVALLSGTVRNEGTIDTPLGSALLAAADKVTLNVNNGSLIGYSIDQGALNALVENNQLIRADGGQVIMVAKALDSLSTAVINNTGVIEARTVQNQNGRILLLGDMNTGTVNLAGKLDASAPNGGDGGAIETSAAHVNVADATVVTTMAAQGNTGTWLIDPVDFTIAASGGSMTGATLSASLNSTDVQIASTSGTTAGNGDIDINDSISWDAATQLTLSAQRNININRSISATNANGKLRLEYGLDSDAAGNTASYNIAAPINLQAGQNFISMLGNNGSALTYTVITDLGSPGSITGTDLQGIAGNPNGRYVLGRDIDASSTSIVNPFTPLTLGISGILDGLGHVISNLTSSVGLFSEISSRLNTVRNLGLINPYVLGTSPYSGALAGINYGLIDNVYVSGGGISGTIVGSLVGMNNGTISNSYASNINVVGSIAGGLVGMNENLVTNSYSSGIVSTNTQGGYAGGLVGENDAFLSNSYSTATVSGTAQLGFNASVGGLVGLDRGNIDHSYATGDVSLSLPVGYVMPLSLGGVGGLVGANTGGSISDVYATGKVSLSGQASATQSYISVGGLIGASGLSTITGSYWDSNSTSQPVGIGSTVRFDGSVVATSTAVAGVTAVAGDAAYSHASYASLGNWSETAAGSGTWIATDSAGKSWVMFEGATRPFLYSEYSTSVGNLHQLQLMGLDLNASYTLAGNIDASATNGTSPSDMWSSRGFAPIASSAAAFNGVFDGFGSTISNLFINQSDTDAVGLFSANTGIIRNLSLSQADVTGGNGVGGVVGVNNGTVSAVHVAGTVVASGQNAGGVVGVNAGSLSNVDSSATVSGTGNTGGVAGSNEIGGDINASSAGGSVVASNGTGNAASNAGGLVGANAGSINNSYAEGIVGGAVVGGLTGINTGSIQDSYAQATVSGAIAGGLAGQNTGSIERVYALGNVSATTSGGGLVGANSGTISTAYASGQVTGNGATATTGGVVGSNSNANGLTNAYWDLSTSGQTNAIGSGSGTATAITGAAAYQHGSYAELGTWSETASGSGMWVATDSRGQAWFMIDGSTRPFLYSEHTSSITNAHQLQLMALDLSANYTLSRDIDASLTGVVGAGMWNTQGFVSVGNATNAFSGSFDGQDNVINKLFINLPGSDQIGLFGVSTGTIKNVGMAGTNVTGADTVGALVGSNAGVVSDVYNTGTVTGTNMVGGVVGINQAGGSIDNIYAEGQVTATGSAGVAGGLAGQNDGAVTTSYALNAVTSGDIAGGLIGVNNGSVDKTYATGRISGGSGSGGLVGSNVGSVANSYWDSTATGKANGVGSGNANGMMDVPYVDTSSWTIAAQFYGNKAYGDPTVYYAGLGNWTQVNNGSNTGIWIATDSNGNKTWVMFQGSTRPFLYSEYSTTIKNLHQLQLAALNATANYTLANDIDASATNSSNLGNFSDMWSKQGFLSIGSVPAYIPISGKYTGDFDGQGHVISNLVVNRDYLDGVSLSVGLINVLTGTLRNIGINGGSIKGSISGGLVGSLSGGTIKNSYSSATVTGKALGAYAGTYGGIAGGLVGQVNAGTITNSYSTGAVAAGIAGGVAGEVDAGSISNVYAAGNVTGVSAGGLIGINSGTVSNVSATGDVNGIINSGDVVVVGGLVGQNNGSITNAYATDKVLAQSGGPSGGLIGQNKGSVSASFWNVDSSGMTIGVGSDTTGAAGSGVSGLSTAEASQQSTFASAGWNIGSTGGTSTIWRIYEGATGPLLRTFLTAVTVNGDAATKTYDGNTSVAATYTTSINGALLGGSLIYQTSRNAGSYSAAAGTLTQSGLYSGQLGYDISYANSGASLTIAKANVTLSNTDAVKTYDGSSTAQSSMTVTSGQLFGADTAIAQAYTYDDKNVGSNKTVSATGVNINDGNGGNNYNISYVDNTSSSISQASITLTSSDVIKTYDGGTSAAGVAAVVGGTLFSGDSISGGNFAFTDKNAGSDKSVTINGVTVGDGVNNGNYNISYVTNTTSTINRAALTVSSSDVTKTYDGNTSAAGTAVVVGGTLFGSDSISGGNFAYTDKNAGNGKSVTVNGVTAGDGVNNDNYDIAYVNNTSSTINKATLTVAANGVNRVYDGTTDATAIYTDNRIQGDQISVDGTAVFGDKNVGTGKQVTISSLQLTGTDAQNYTFSTNTLSTSADITPATLSVTADSVSKFYDGGAYTGNSGVTITGFVHGETLADLGGTLSYTGSALGASAVGNYIITPAGLSGGNYRVVFINGQLSIKSVDQIAQRSQTSVALGGTGMEQAYDAAIQFNGINRSNPVVMQPGWYDSFSLPTQDLKNGKEDRSTATQNQAGAQDSALSEQVTPRLIVAGSLDP